MSTVPDDGEKIAAACLVAQRSVVVAVSGDGRPLWPAFSWLDKRRAESCETIPKTSTAQREQQICSKANWLKCNHPELYTNTARFLSASGWLIYRLTGQFCDSIGGLGGVFPLDVDRLAWSNDPSLYRLLGMPAERLPHIYPPGAIVGHISPKAAAQTGLPEGLALVAGAGDKSCEMLGAGAIRSDQGYVSYGTMATLQVQAVSPGVHRNNQYWRTPGAIPATWNMEFGVECGYLMLDWFCEHLLPGFQELAIRSGRSVEQVLAEQASLVPAGAEGLVLAPYWSATGDASELKSVLAEFGKSHTPSHLFRALLEGIALRLRDGMDMLEEDRGVVLREIFIGGGGAQSDLALQITADVFALPISRVQTVQTCALGAAIEAAMGIGLFQSYAEAVSAMSRQERVFQPQKDHCKVYDTIYTQMYPHSNPRPGQISESKQMIRSVDTGDQYVG